MSWEMDKQLEERLKRVQPAPPSDLLEARIEDSLRAKQRQQRMSRIRQGLSWGGFAVAASVLIIFGILLFNGRLDLSSPESESPTEPEMVRDLAVEPASDRSGEEDGFEPVVAENNLKGRVDEGIVFLRNGLTARRYRYEFIDRVVWRNPSDGAVIEMEVPRDEVVLVPVQTF